MSKAFIVYPAEQRTLAVRLWDELRWNGLDVGIDLQDAPPHLERTAVLEDLITASSILLVLLSPQGGHETRRLHLLGIEQGCTVIALVLPGSALPPELKTAQTVLFGNYEMGLAHLLRILPQDVLHRNPDPDRILENLHHPDADVRRATLFMVGKSRLAVGLQPAMSLLLTDPVPDVRAAAAWALDRLNNVEAASALLHALYDDEQMVRFNVSWALVNLGRRRDAPASRAVVPAVIDVLQDEAHPAARRAAYQVLVRIGGREARDAIERYWND